MSPINIDLDYDTDGHRIAWEVIGRICKVPPVKDDDSSIYYNIAHRLTLDKFLFRHHPLPGYIPFATDILNQLVSGSTYMSSEGYIDIPKYIRKAYGNNRLLNEANGFNTVERLTEWLNNGNCPPPPPTSHSIEEDITIVYKSDRADLPTTNWAQTKPLKASLEPQIVEWKNTLEKLKKRVQSLEIQPWYKPHLQGDYLRQVNEGIQFIEEFALPRKNRSIIEQNFKRINDLIDAGLNDYSVSDKLKAGTLLLISTLSMAVGVGEVVGSAAAGGTTTGTMSGTAAVGRTILSKAAANDNAWALAASFLAYIGIGNSNKK